VLALFSEFAAVVSVRQGCVHLSKALRRSIGIAADGVRSLCRGCAWGCSRVVSAVQRSCV
jgi:hypothetical protein